MIESNLVPTNDVILVGAGPNHIEMIHKYASLEQKPFRLTLIASDSYHYPRTCFAELALGNLTIEKAGIDAGQLCHWAGANYIHGDVIHLDTINNCISLRNGTKISYDLISLDLPTQSYPASLGSNGQTRAISLFPATSFATHITAAIEEIKKCSKQEPFELVISGGNVTAYEITWAIASRLKKQILAGHLRVRLVIGKHEKRPLPTSIAKPLIKRLEQIGVVTSLKTTIAEYDETSRSIRLTNNSQLSCDLLIWANIYTAPHWLTQTDLQLDKHGFLCALPNFESSSQSNVYVSGEAISLPQYQTWARISHDRDMAHILSSNILRRFQGITQARYTPNRFTSIRLPGDEILFLSNGKFSHFSLLLGAAERRLRRNYFARFQPPTRPARVSTYLESGRIDFSPVGGESCRIPLELTKPQSFKELALGERLLPKHVTIDHSNNRCQITINLRDFTHDLFSFGQIATNHLLNYLFCFNATNSQIHLALSLPYAPKKVLQRDFDLLLSAVKTVTTPLAINIGTVNVQASATTDLTIFGQGALTEKSSPAFFPIRSPGTIILTQPLGTGIASAGFQNFHLSTDHFLQAQSHMKKSHFRMGELLTLSGLQTIYPISGFGLALETFTVLDKDLAIKIDLEALPSLPGIEAALNQGVRTSLHVQNRLPFTSSIENIPKAWRCRAELLFDPQTSGPLIMICTQKAADDLLSRLHHLGFKQACMIGEIVTYSDPSRSRLQFS